MRDTAINAEILTPLARNLQRLHGVRKCLSALLQAKGMFFLQPAKLAAASRLAASIITIGTGMLPLGLASAEVQTITASHTYMMGDNDSRNDARHLCFLEAKRKVLEQAGSFIQSHSVVDNFNLTKDQITSYSAAVLSVETVKEELGSINGQNTLTLTVKADVDADQVKKLVGAIVADRSLAYRVTQQQQQIRQLDEELKTLNSRLSDAPINSAGELRKERTVVFDNMTEQDRVKLVATQRIADERDKIRQTTELILKYVARGMTQNEVRKLAGEPIFDHNPTWDYGDLAVCFKDPFSRKDYRVAAVIRPVLGEGRAIACMRPEEYLRKIDILSE